MNRLDALPDRAALVDWLLTRQVPRIRTVTSLTGDEVSGFQGRTNKPADSCYSFWIGATLDILGKYDLVQFDLLKSFIMSCSSMGGFGKLPGVVSRSATLLRLRSPQYPDVLHTYFSLCGLSLGGFPGIKPVHGPLGFSREVAQQFPNPWK